MCPYEFKNKTDSWYPSDNGKITPSMFSYGYSTYKRFTSNGKII